MICCTGSMIARLPFSCCISKEISLIKDSVLMDYEWKLLLQLLELLLPLEQEQKVLEGDKYVTISKVPFSVKHLIKHLDTFANKGRT